MDNYQKLYITRLEQWKERLEYSLFTQSLPLPAKVSTVFTVDKILSFSKKDTLRYRPISIGDTWGKTWQLALFHIKFVPDAKWQDFPLLAYIDIGGEGLIYDRQGNPIQAITNGSVFNVDPFKRGYVHLTKYKKNKEIELWIEATASGLFGIDKPNDPYLEDTQMHGTYEAKIRKMEYTIFDKKLWDFICDVDVLVSLLRGLDDTSVRKARLLELLMEAAAVYADKKENLSKAKKITDALLRNKAEPSALIALSVGHAHIDTAWLWANSETKRKCVRTFSSQLELLDRYPDYIFGASSAQHYVYIKEQVPSMYKRIQQYVKEGRWELQGGMWIEADCNIPSGESHIRQFLYGKNFFMDEFGIDVTILWLPDVFGYSANLPQIMKGCGVDAFLTQKLSWSQFNTFPHHSFHWQGIDGTSVLTHFPPEDTYNSILSPDGSNVSEGMIGAQKAFIEKGKIDEFLVLYGVGDGGGGPTDEMIERGRRMANLEGVPKVQFATSKALFSKLHKQSALLNTWVGELYLEYHRGTLTTQAKVKYYNRKLEYALQSIEKIACMGTLSSYPQKELDRWWKTLLLNQFHDIIPGSSIHKVYEETHKQYKEMDIAIKKESKKILSSYTKKNPNALTVFNNHSYNSRILFELPKSWEQYTLVDTEGNEIPSQGTIACLTMKQHQISTLFKSKRKKTLTQMQKSLVLENTKIRYRFDNKGRLINIYDKEHTKIVLAGIGNVFTLYEDRPHIYDAWDIDQYYENCIQQRPEAEQVILEENGPVYSSISFVYNFNHSLLQQRVVLYKHSKRLDFITEVEWKERHSMLRVHFPVSIYNSVASYDIQYGYIHRPTHRNTSWDKARFECMPINMQIFQT